MQVPGGSCGIITTGHRGHGAIVPNGRTCRHFLTNPSYFMCRRAGVVGWHLERRRARPGPPTRCCRTRSGRGRCARDTPSRRGDPGFGGLPLLQPEDPAAPAAPSTPAAARRRVLGAAGQRAPSPGTAGPSPSCSPTSPPAPRTAPSTPTPHQTHHHSVNGWVAVSRDVPDPGQRRHHPPPHRPHRHRRPRVHVHDPPRPGTSPPATSGDRHRTNRRGPTPTSTAGTASSC